MPDAAGVPHGPVAVSVVSHGHDALLPRLLEQLAATGAGRIGEVFVTHNLPAPWVAADARWPFVLHQRTNDRPAGFGRNHNRSFARTQCPWFCVLNPDIDLPDPGVWDALLAAASQPAAGCAFPALQNPDGSPQDHVRPVPTPRALVRRRLLRQPEQGADWASAAFWLVPAAVFRQLGGFDERYYMYCEDVDFCLRLQTAGYRLVQADAAAIHAAHRRTWRELTHLRWHLRSLWRLWTGDALRSYRRMRGAA